MTKREEYHWALEQNVIRNEIEKEKFQKESKNHRIKGKEKKSHTYFFTLIRSSTFCLFLTFLFQTKSKLLASITFIHL